MATSAELKKALTQVAIEVYRTLRLKTGAEVVHVAERVRENLIMDSGIRVDMERLSVSFRVRAQRSDFPQEPTDTLFERARLLGDPARERGFTEIEREVTKVADPGDQLRTIDTWCEVIFEKTLPNLEHVVEEVRFALPLEKTVPRVSPPSSDGSLDDPDGR